MKTGRPTASRQIHFAAEGNVDGDYPASTGIASRGVRGAGHGAAPGVARERRSGRQNRGQPPSAFLRDDVPWAQRPMTREEIRSVALDESDAQLALARWYDFLDWPRLVEFVEAVTKKDSPVFAFESAVEAVVDGDTSALTARLRADPQLVHTRSTRVCHF